MIATRSLVVAVSAVAACADPGPPEPLGHAFPPVQNAPGESVDQCQSWTLGNEDPIFVNAVAMTNSGGLHHSNWFFVPDDVYAGPDGTWGCESRNFDQSAAVLAGGVLFAQSTQATAETLSFVDNAAYIIPPHSRIVGNLHLLNASDVAIDTAITLELRPIREDAAEILLSPASFTYQDLAIPPMARSRFTTTCDVQAAYGAPLDFRFYYMLPHYHALGTKLDLVVDMPSGPVSVFGSGGHIGDVKSQKLDPPFDASGASTMRFSCEYDNPGPDTIGWGNGSGEMCILVAWTDNPNILFNLVMNGSVYTGTVDGVMEYEGPCGVAFFPN